TVLRFGCSLFFLSQTVAQFQYLNQLHRRLDRLTDLMANAFLIFSQERFKNHEEKIQELKDQMQEQMQALNEVIDNEAAATKSFLSNKSRIKPVYSEAQQDELMEVIQERLEELLNLIQEYEDYQLDLSEAELELEGIASDMSA
ncbi:MAG: hypothetical protein AAFO94_22615, partial [Bacteroidota bacterium]